MKKKFVVGLLSVITVFSMAGCGVNGVLASVSADPVNTSINSANAALAENTPEASALPSPSASAALNTDAPDATPRTNMGSAGGIVTDMHAKPTPTASPDATDAAQSPNAGGSGTSSATPAPSAYMVDPDKPMIALTFDDGPSSDATGIILDALELAGARATFFVQGKQVLKNPSMTIRAHDIGCEIGNHTYGHENLTKISDAEFDAQVNDMVEMINELTDFAPVLLRPPYGARDDRVRALSKFPLILWSIDTLDWSTRDTQSTVDAILNYVRDGDIVLMHDLYLTTAEAVKIVVPELISRGYQLVTVSEMFAAKGIEFVAGQDYRKTY